MPSLPALSVALRRLDQPVPEVGAQDRLVGRQRLGEPDAIRLAVVRHETPGVRLEPAGADEDVLDEASQTLLAGQPSATWRSAAAAWCGTSSSLKRPTSSTRSTSRVTSRARQLGTVTVQAVGNLEAEPVEHLLLLLGRGREPEQRVDALRPEADDRPVRQLALHVGRAGPARAGQLDEELRRVDGRLLGQLWIDALLPAGRGLRPSRSRRELRRIVSGSKFAASSRTSVVSA